MVHRSPHRHRGVVSILAMMFIVIFASLAAAMAVVTQGNLRTAETYRQVNRSLAAAETGLKYTRFRLASIAKTIETTKGQITPEVADDLWPKIRDAIVSRMGDDLHLQHHQNPVVVQNPDRLRVKPIPISGDDDAPSFELIIERHGQDFSGNYDAELYQREPYNAGGGNNRFTTDGDPVSETDPFNPVQRNWVRVRAIGHDGGYERSVHMDFRIGKKLRYAILSRNRIMIGRNVEVAGDIGSRFTHVDKKHGHPVQMRNNFRGLSGALDNRLDWLTGYLADNDTDGDNRVHLANDAESAEFSNAAEFDRNGDGYVDAYDMFLLEYDETGPNSEPDGRLNIDEFTNSGGELIDPQLWKLINEMKYPPGTEFDWQQYAVKEPGEEWTDAQDDLTTIDETDAYAKIQGRVKMKASQREWEQGAAEGAYQQYFKGSIEPDPTDAPLTFSADGSQIADLSAQDFDVAQYRQMANNTLVDQIAQGKANDTSEPTVYTPPSAQTREAVPYKSPHPYDHYDRPVIKNYTFENVRIPKGTNALFVNCKFKGVTFVEAETDNDHENFNYAGMTDEDGEEKYTSATAEVDVDDDGSDETVPNTKPYGNNLRFHDCQFDGAVATAVPQSFSHVRNKLQFTGQTGFNPDAESLSREERQLAQKSTLMAPQYSVDMGSFTEPTASDHQVHLKGTIVAGVFDVRGQAVIDGGIVSTYSPEPGDNSLAHGGNPASFNTTIGYFGPDAGDPESEVPEAGDGKILLRYDEDRAMPDGINAPIEIRPDRMTYHEGKP